MSATHTYTNPAFSKLPQDWLAKAATTHESLMHQMAASNQTPREEVLKAKKHREAAARAFANLPPLSPAAHHRSAPEAATRAASTRAARPASAQMAKEVTEVAFAKLPRSARLPRLQRLQQQMGLLKLWIDARKATMPAAAARSTSSGSSYKTANEDWESPARSSRRQWGEASTGPLRAASAAAKAAQRAAKAVHRKASAKAAQPRAASAKAVQEKPPRWRGGAE